MKKKIAIISIIIFFLIIIGICVTILYKNKQKEIAQKQEEYKFKWCSNYIWDTTSTNNTWMCFRKKINIEKEEDLKQIIAQIAVDSKYWLYINGEMVIREGAVKRGETRNSIYYDQIDLTEYFNLGENTIAVLVWYWGDTSYSHNSSGQGAFLFQTRIGENYIVSDESWKVSKHPAYLQDELRPNKRLIEYNVYYDSSKEFADWYKINYDDSLWEYANVLGEAGDEMWGELIKRDIPQFKNSEIIEYKNIENYREYVLENDEKLEMIIPYNAQFTPYLKIESPEDGLKITIKTDMYEDVSGDSVKCTYLTKKGIQEFESLAWMNGENVYYEIPKGIKIISLGYRETGYATEMTGKFSSNDEFFNELWKKASRTLYINMRDSYMDCPNRERAQWTGDMNIEMMEAMYALDTNANSLYEKGVKTTIGWRENDVLLTVSPITDDFLHLPTQMLAGINSFYEYYEYTGKKEFLEYVYPYAKNYLNLWKMNEETGLMNCIATYPTWEWGDSVAECDYKAIENAWYYLALSKMEKMAQILGYEQDKIEIATNLEKLKFNYNKLWTEKGYKTSDVEFIDERANAIAVISGIADSKKYDVIKEILTSNYQSTTYMEKFALQALCEMGYIEEAQSRIKERYKDMLYSEFACSTLWENWNPEIGTRNHAWAGGPLIIMSKYFAGIEPLEEGYETISIKPQFGSLNEISAKVTTVKGEITLEAKKSENETCLKISVPTRAKIAVEKESDNAQIIINRKVVFKNNKEKNKWKIKYDTQDDKYIYFWVEKGEYNIISK